MLENVLSSNFRSNLKSLACVGLAGALSLGFVGGCADGKEKTRNEVISKQKQQVDNDWVCAGEVVDGLQALIKSEKEEYSLNDTLKIYYTIRNTSKESRLIIYHTSGYTVGLPPTYLHLNILDYNNHEINYRKFVNNGLRPIIAPPTIPEYKIVKPNEQLKGELVLQLSRGLFYQELQKGEYTFNLEVSSNTKNFYYNPPKVGPSPSKPLEKLPEGIIILSKSIKSNLIKIKINK